MRAFGLAMVALAGCEGDGKTEGCSGPEDKVSYSSCVIPAEDTPEGADWADPGELELEIPSARVEEVGSGAPPNGCLDANRWLGGREVDDTEGWWVEVVDPEGARWTVAATAGGATPDVEVGQEVGIRWLWQENSPFAGHYPLEVLTLEDFEGALIAWVGDGGDLASLDAPSEVSLSRGEEIYREEQACYTEVGYQLDVSVGEASASLCFGESASLGGFAVMHGYTVVGEDLSCSETSGDGTSVAVVR